MVTYTNSTWLLQHVILKKWCHMKAILWISTFMNQFSKFETIAKLFKWQVGHFFILECSSFFFSTCFCSKTISKKSNFVCQITEMYPSSNCNYARSEILTLLNLSHIYYNNVILRKCLQTFLIIKKALCNSFLLIYVRFIK